MKKNHRKSKIFSKKSQNFRILSKKVKIVPAKSQKFNLNGRKDKSKTKSKLPSFQVIPGHGNPQERRTMFICYLFKYCCVKCQTFHRVCEKAS